MSDAEASDIEAPFGAAVNAWTDMYRGALIALDVTQLREADALGALTCSDGEAWAAIAIMRKSPAGSKVSYAIEWLRMRREGGVSHIEDTP